MALIQKLFLSLCRTNSMYPGSMHVMHSVSEEQGIPGPCVTCWTLLHPHFADAHRRSFHAAGKHSTPFIFAPSTNLCSR